MAFEKTMKSSIIKVCLSGILALLISFPSYGQRVLLDRVIALVDQDVVLQSELDIRIADIRGAAARDSQPLPPEDELESEILEALIIENIQLQMAEQVSIRFDDDMINRVLSNMASNNNLSFEQYLEALETAGVYLQTREQVRRQMMLQELQRGMVNRRITITDQEIDNFLNSDMGKEVMSTDYFVDHLLIAFSDGDSTAEKDAKLKYAADIIARVGEGETFIDVRANARQANTFPIESTDFGWRKADQLPNLFSDIVIEMEPGEVQGPIEAGNGFHVIHLGGQRGGTEQFVNQTEIRHIMLTPNEIRNEDQTIAEINELRERIIAGEDFAVIARQHSDDASSVVGGGDLDWVSEGGMPPEFEQVVDALDENELSEPFQTATGWHIAEVLGRRETDLSLEYSRSQAENTLRGRKFDLELQNWLIEIREEAFVELVE
jgi:peptidyl-prolyl cis-trans isomerase SurA